MPIQVKCPNKTCAKSMTVKDEFAGKTGKCPSCGTPVKVPVLTLGPAKESWDSPDAEPDTVDGEVSTPNPERPAASPTPPPGSIRAQCKACGKVLNVKPQFAGKVGKCPDCGKPVQVPPAPVPSLPTTKKMVRPQIPPVPAQQDPKPARKPAMPPGLDLVDDPVEVEVEPPPQRKPAAARKAPRDEEVEVVDDDPVEVEVELPPQRKAAAAQKPPDDEEVEVVDEEEPEVEVEPPPKRKPAMKPPRAEEDEPAEEEEVEDADEENSERFRRKPGGLELPQMLAIGGMAALALVAVSTFLPWASVTLGRGFGNLSVSGINAGGIGIVAFIFALGAAVFAGVSMFAVPKLFPWGILAGVCAGGICFLLLLVKLIEFSTVISSPGFGLYVGVAMAAAAAGLFAFPAIGAIKELTGKQPGKKSRKPQPKEDEAED